MLFKPLPQNIDLYLLQDHLFQTLKKNKLTQKLINLRAQQIVKSLLKESLDSQISNKYTQICTKLQEAQNNCQRLQKEMQKAILKQQKRKKNLILDMKSQRQNILMETNNQLQSKEDQIIRMEEQIRKLQESFSNLQLQYKTLVDINLQKNDEIQLLSKQNQEINMRIKQITNQFHEYRQTNQLKMQKVFFQHQQKMDKSLSKIKNIKNTLLENQTKIKELTTQNSALKKLLQEKQKILAEKSIESDNYLKKSNKQIQKLKKQLNQSQENYLTLKKQILKFKNKYEKFQDEHNSMKQSFQVQQKLSSQRISSQQIKISSLEIKIKDMTDKIQNLSSTNKKFKKTLLKLKNHFFTYFVTLKQQNLTLKSFLKQNFDLIKDYSQTSVMKVVNYLSSELSIHFQECVYEIKKARQEKHFAKQQVKIKTQIIEHLDRMLDNETKSVYDLRYELKQKIKEQQKLRQKLKTHYHETDKKLEEFQSKYISILKNDF